MLFALTDAITLTSSVEGKGFFVDSTCGGMFEEGTASVNITSVILLDNCIFPSVFAAILQVKKMRGDKS